MTEISLTATLTEEQLKEAIGDWLHKKGYSHGRAKITLHRTAGHVDQRDGVNTPDTYGATIAGIERNTGNLSTDTPEKLAYLAAAKLRQKDGELEIDNTAKVSLGDDPGAYVQAWIWVSNKEAGLPEPEED